MNRGKSETAVLRKMYLKSMEDTKTLKLQIEMEQRKQERLEKSLRQELDLFKQSFENSLSPMAILDKDFNFVIVNKAYAEVDEKNISDFPGRNHFDLYPSDAKHIFENVVKTKLPYSVSHRGFVYEANRERGVTFWDWILMPVLDQENEVKYLILSLHNVTEKVHKAEELNYLFDLSQDGFLLIGFDGTIRRINQSFLNIFDINPKLNTETSLFELLKTIVDSDDYQFMRKALKRMLSGYSVNEFQHRCRLKNKVEKWFSWKGIPCLEREIVFITVRDISDQMKAVKELQTNEHRLEALLKLSQMDEASLPDIINFALKQGAELTSSIIGWVGILNDDQLTADFYLWKKNKCYHYVIRNEEDSLFPIPGAASFWQVVSSRRALIITEQGACKSNQTQAISDPINNRIVVPVYEGRQISMVGGVANKKGSYSKLDVKQFTLLLSGIWKVVQQHKMEQKLKKSQESFQKIFELNPNGVSIQRFETNEYFEVNKSFEFITGFSREEVLGKSPYELKIMKYEDSVDKLKGEKEAEFCRNQEIKIFTKSGKEKIILKSSVIIELSGEQFFINVINDITEQKQIEKEMARLDRLNSIGQMSAGISHEIRNPLSVVRGFLQLLNEKEELAPFEEELRLMIDELDRANFIISEFLSLARNKPVDIRMHNLNTIIQNLFPLLQADAIVNDQTINLELGGIPSLFLDEKEIRQLILNLSRNGLEAMTQGGILTIKTFYTDGGVLLGVSDQGRGIDPDTFEKMGTPFFTTKEQGTGLGLAICYSIVARHNAEMSIETSPQGTTFWVQFIV
ncbi:MAG: PAS domain S-box protein [Dehalobacterium sp.]